MKRFSFFTFEKRLLSKDINQTMKEYSLGLSTIRNLLEQGAWIDTPGEFLDILLVAQKSLASSLRIDIEAIKKHPCTLEDVHACLSILCEQQQRIEDEIEFKKIKLHLDCSIEDFPLFNKKVYPISKWSQAAKQAAHEKLNQLDQFHIKKIDEATNRNLPWELTKIIQEYTVCKQVSISKTLSQTLAELLLFGKKEDESSRLRLS
jgi:hypothetical protein